MGVELYAHNREAYERAVEMMAACGKAAVVHPTGTGKSFIGFELARRHAAARILWLTPSEYIVRTQLENWKKAGAESCGNIQFVTYSKLMLLAEDELALLCPEYIVLDEFHRCGAEKWGQGVQRLLAAYPRAGLLGLSATNVRYLDNQRDMAQELFEGHIASYMTLGEAVVRGILPAPVYVSSVYSYRQSLEAYEKKVKAVRGAGQGAQSARYLEALRRALEKAGYGHIPVVSVNLNGMEKNEGFTLSKGLIMDAVHALVYGDLFMRCLYHVRPYELEKGSAEAIHQKWKEICVDSLVNPKTKWRYADVCRGIVADFDELPIAETLRKPRVGIVGEILVKYMPLANNHLVELLEAEGAEAVVPDLLDFFNYSIYGRDFRHKNLGTSWKDSVVAKAGVEMLRRLRAPALEALEKSCRFEAPMPIEDVAKLAEPFLAIGNQYGEGWFLTGEMAELLTSGTPNIVCIQPFACLPNHVVGKGVIKALRRAYPWANIVAVDYDPGASEVNQLNRIKLMLSSARRAMHSGAAQDAEALPMVR